MKIATAFVEMRVDSDKAKDEARSEARDVAQEMTKQFAQYFSAAVVVKGLKDAVDAASRLEQAVGGTEAIFGEASASVDNFAKTSAEALGISEASFREITSQIGGLLNGLGFTQEESAKTSISLTQLGADLAATFGGKPEEAVQALGAALRGEFNPLERFGVSLRVSQINLKAVELGLAESTTQVDGNARAQAALALITEQTAQAQGQFGREAETAAGKSAILAAKFEDAKATLGTELLPIFVQGVGVLQTMVEAFSALPGPVQTVVVALVAISVVSGPIRNAASAVRGMSTAMTSASASAVAMNAAMAAVVIAYVGHQQKMQKANERFVESITEIGEASDESIGTVFVNSLIAGSFAGKSLEERLAEIADGSIEGARRMLDLEASTGALTEAFVLNGSTAEHAATVIAGLEAAVAEEERATAQAEQTASEYGSTLDGVTESTDDGTTATREYWEAQTGQIAAFEAQRKSAADLEAELELLIDAVNRANGVMYVHEEAAIRLDQAYDDYKAQIAEGTAILQDETSTLEEKEKVLEDLRLTEIALAKDALATAEAFAEEQGAAEGSAEAAALQIQELVRQRREYPELRDEIDKYITNLAGIPGAVPTDVQALIDEGKYAEALRRLQSLERVRTVRLKVQSAGVSDYVPEVNGGTRRNAQGGYYGSFVPSTSLVEDGDPEAVLPLAKPSRLASLLADPRIGGPIADAMPQASTASGTVGGMGAMQPLIINLAGERQVKGWIDQRDAQALAEFEAGVQ